LTVVVIKLGPLTCIYPLNQPV